MATTIVSVKVGKNVVLEIRADFAQASSPIEVRDGMGQWKPTLFQVASAGHDPIEACKMVNRWFAREGGEAWEPGRTRGLVASYERG